MFAVAAAILTLGSCTWLLSGFNHIEIDGERYELSDLTVGYVDEADGIFENVLIFTSADLDVDDEGFPSGSGNWVQLRTLFPGQAISDGTYTFSSEIEAFVVVDGFAYGGIDTVDETWDSVADLTEGQFAIRETLGGDFVFEFNFTGYDFDSEQDVSVTGRYRGPIDEEFTSELLLSTAGARP